jgi:hypothetical protein
VLDRHVRVVDQRLAVVYYRVAADAERQRSVVDPVRAVGEAISLDPPVVEGEDVLRRAERAQASPR